MDQQPPHLETSISLGKTRILYFGYGSNMWLAQMQRRCPESQYIGIAVLPGWRWMINDRGYANVVPSPGDFVWGLVYSLSELDEETLDLYEGVPNSYIKKTMKVTLSPEVPVAGSIVGGSVVDALIYVDELRLHDDKPREEYVHRMNMAIGDAVREGVPLDFIEKYLRPFIPKVGSV